MSFLLRNWKCSSLLIWLDCPIRLFLRSRILVGWIPCNGLRRLVEEQRENNREDSLIFDEANSLVRLKKNWEKQSDWIHSAEDWTRRHSDIDTIDPFVQERMDIFDLFYLDLVMIQWLTKTPRWTNEIRRDSDVDRSEKNERESFDEKHRETISAFNLQTFRDEGFFQQSPRITLHLTWKITLPIFSRSACRANALDKTCIL